MITIKKIYYHLNIELINYSIDIQVTKKKTLFDNRSLIKELKTEQQQNNHFIVIIKIFC
jgi:hypothetical protein